MPRREITHIQLPIETLAAYRQTFCLPWTSLKTIKRQHWFDAIVPLSNNRSPFLKGILIYVRHSFVRNCTFVQRAQGTFYKLVRTWLQMQVWLMKPQLHYSSLYDRTCNRVIHANETHAMKWSRNYQRSIGFDSPSIFSTNLNTILKRNWSFIKISSVFAVINIKNNKNSLSFQVYKTVVCSC